MAERKSERGLSQLCEFQAHQSLVEGNDSTAVFNICLDILKGQYSCTVFMDIYSSGL